MIQVLRNELQTNMAYLGATNVRDLKRTLLITSKLERLLVDTANL